MDSIWLFLGRAIVIFVGLVLLFVAISFCIRIVRTATRTKSKDKDE